MVIFKGIMNTFNKLGFVFVLFLCLSLALCVSCSSSITSVDEMEEPIIDIPIETTTFRNPILDEGADPWVFKNGDEYLVTFTTGNNITLLRTNKMSNIKNATRKVVWIPPATGFNSKEIWAPELHKINSKWYVYYAASDGNNENHKMWVLENTSEDPLQGTWEDKGELKLPGDKWAIDGSPFEINGKQYFIWSGWEGDFNVRQDIYIAQMENPTTVIGERINLIKPKDAWEINNTNPQVTEGPQFVLKNGKAFIFYSAGGCWTDGYSIGAIWMESTANPLELDSWERMETNPLFTTNNTGNAFGPGHNSFFKSLNNDEDWILYHANPQPGQGCGGNRTMRMQKFTWDSNNFPIFGTPEPLNKDLKKPSGE
jgi:GH43 family beta-xylosidase